MPEFLKIIEKPKQDPYPVEPKACYVTVPGVQEEIVMVVEDRDGGHEFERWGVLDLKTGCMKTKKWTNDNTIISMLKAGGFVHRPDVELHI